MLDKVGRPSSYCTVLGKLLDAVLNVAGYSGLLSLGKPASSLASGMARMGLVVDGMVFLIVVIVSEVCCGMHEEGLFFLIRFVGGFFSEILINHVYI